MAVTEAQLKAFLVRTVDEFARDRRAPGYIRWFAEHLPYILIPVGIEMLLNSPESPGFRYLCMQMLKQPSFFREIADPWKYTVPQAVTLARSLYAVDPALDIKIARSLPRRTGQNEGALTGEWAERALQILDQISAGRRIVPVLNHLANHKDLRISSKSTLLIGRRVQNLSWARRLVEEGRDHRIRANAIEALWGVCHKTALQLFRSSLKDEHNRVVGNSILGLHLAGDREVSRFLEKSAEDCKATFRMTASWVMGRIGDPAYVTPLSLLVRDVDPRVRSAALRSLLEIRQEEKWRAAREIQLTVNAEAESAAREEQPVRLEEATPEIAIDFWLEGQRVG